MQGVKSSQRHHSYAFFQPYLRSWASTYVLSKLSVVQHSTLGCLRRLFVIVVTCVFFGVPLTVLGCAGIVMSFLGFVFFTHFRRRRLDDAKSFNAE